MKKSQTDIKQLFWPTLANDGFGVAYVFYVSQIIIFVCWGLPLLCRALSPLTSNDGRTHETRRLSLHFFKWIIS